MTVNVFTDEQLVFNVIQGQIGYRFNNPELLRQALTRRSYSEEHGGENNEVLEFIGDKVLDYFAVKLLIEKSSNSKVLYESFRPRRSAGFFNPTESSLSPEESVLKSDCSEARLTELKKLLVQKKTLAKRIDDLQFADYLIMGSGDVKNGLNQEASVKEDLFEAILGAVAIDCNWDADTLEQTVDVMLAPDLCLEDTSQINYVQLILDWQRKDGLNPFFKYFERSYSATMYMKEDGVVYQRISNLAFNYSKLKFSCYLKIRDNLPIFCGFGASKGEARRAVCELAYNYLEEKNISFSIRDELDNPNPSEAISQLEILARRGYFSIPTYGFKLMHDNDGNPIWESTCRIAELSRSFSAKSSSKKAAKKAAAFQMLDYVMNE